MNDQLDEKLLKSLKTSIRNGNYSTVVTPKRNLNSNRFNKSYSPIDEAENKKLEYMEKYITINNNNKNISNLTNSSSDLPASLDINIPNTNIEKDVKRILISLLIHLLVKIFNKKYFLITLVSYLLIAINILYLVIKVIIIARKKNLSTQKRDEMNNVNLLKTIDMINTYKNINTLDDLDDNSLSKKTFFDNIGDTPLRQRQQEKGNTNLELNNNTNTIESSYIPSSKFNYKINNA